MSGHHTEQSDTGAAFMGLIGGSLFIGIILYGIVLWTNSLFAGHGAAEGGEHKAAAAFVTGKTVA